VIFWLYYYYIPLLSLGAALSVCYLHPTRAVYAPSTSTCTFSLLTFYLEVEKSLGSKVGYSEPLKCPVWVCDTLNAAARSLQLKRTSKLWSMERVEVASQAVQSG